MIDRATVFEIHRLAREGYPLRDRAAFALVGASALEVPALAGDPGSAGRLVLLGVGAVVLLAVVAVAVTWFTPLGPGKARELLFTGEYIDGTEAERSALGERIGVMFQDGALFSSLTVRENVEVPMRAIEGRPSTCRPFGQ